MTDLASWSIIIPCFPRKFEQENFVRKSDNCRGISAQARGAWGNEYVRAERADTQATYSRRRCRFRLNHTHCFQVDDHYLRGEVEDGKKIKEATQCDIAATVMSVVMLHAQEAGDISETRPRNNAPASRHARAYPTLRGVYNCNCKCNPCENDSPSRRYKIRPRVGLTATAISRNNSHRDNARINVTLLLHIETDRCNNR